MKIALIYICPSVNIQVFHPAAQRFARSYMDNPPGETDHELWVCVNGASETSPVHERLFSPLAPRFFTHNNWGKDIGAFQVAADTIECDLLICFGSFVHFHRAGWLDRIAQVYLEHGPAVYGAWAFDQPRPHIRTTVFWLPPELLRMYPNQIGDQDRYGFEHGPESLTLWAQSKGFDTYMVSWSACYPHGQWRHISPDDSLMFEQHMHR